MPGRTSHLFKVTTVETVVTLNTVETSLIHANTCNANSSVKKKASQGSDKQYHLIHGNLFIELRAVGMRLFILINNNPYNH